MKTSEQVRHRTAWVLILFAGLLVLVNIGTLLTLNRLITTNYSGCKSGNVLRADVRLVLRQTGHPVKATAVELRRRPCDDLYGKIIPFR